MGPRSSYGWRRGTVPRRPHRESQMPRKIAIPLAILLPAVVAAAISANRPPSDPNTAASTRPAASSAHAAHAIFAGGCFWCVETAFEGVKGVQTVVSGYTGGPEKNPTYEQVSNGQTGHYESIDISYDPTQVSYQKLLDILWHNIDPTQDDGQFCDHG